MKRILFILLLSSPAWATFTLVQQTQNDSCATSATCIVTMSATGTGNVAFVAFRGPTGGTARTISSVSAGGTFTVCTACAATGSQNTGIAYTLATTSGVTSITLTLNGSATTPWQVYFAEYSFTGSSVAFDYGNLVTNGTNTLRGGVDLTGLTGANDLLLQVICPTTAITISAINGAYTTANHLGLAFGFASAINTTTGTAPTWTFSGNSISAGSGIALKEIAGGGAVVRHRATVIN